jgi:hypothetical protein
MKCENPGIHPLLHLKKTLITLSSLGLTYHKKVNKYFLGRGGTLPHLDTLYSFNEVFLYQFVQFWQFSFL